MLISGRNQIKRMLLFSEEKSSDIFTGFGLALVNKEDPKAYSYIKQIIDEAQKYGKLEGRFSRLSAGMEKYPTVVTLILSIITLILAISNILPYK
jgi:hypothetical protein